MWAIIDQSDPNRHVVIALDHDDRQKPSPPDHIPPYLVEIVQPGVEVGMVRGGSVQSVSNFGFESVFAALAVEEKPVVKKKQARKPPAKKPLLQKQVALKPVARKKAKRGK